MCLAYQSHGEIGNIEIRLNMYYAFHSAQLRDYCYVFFFFFFSVSRNTNEEGIVPYVLSLHLFDISSVMTTSSIYSQALHQ